jgi:hypothetical protein
MRRPVAGEPDEVTDSVARAYLIAEQLIARPDIIPQAGGGSSGFESSPPWNAAAANAHMGIHAAARRAEDELLDLVGGQPSGRGGSDGNTLRALEAVVRLANGVGQDLADEILADLARLADDAATLPAWDEADRWVPLPRAPGQLPPGCPYCKDRSLRFIRGKLLIACCRPGCKDGDGNRPAARVDRSPVDKTTPAMLWNDGLVT